MLNRNFLKLFCALILLLTLLVQLVNAVHHEAAGGEPLSTGAELSVISGKTSAETFSFEDVYRIEMNLAVAVDLQLIATDENRVSVTLEKQTQATNTASDAVIRAYLDNISVAGTQNEGTLHLKVQLPEAKPNSLLKMESLSAALHLKCTVKTPADISVKLRAKTGDIRLARIRGEIDIETETGNVHVDETSGNYRVALTKGNIHGRILLTRGENKLETKDGSIGLMILDTVAAPMDITAQGGSIKLQLPETYAADVELESEKQQVVISLPVQTDDTAALTLLNGGGPRFRLKATDAISLLPSTRNSESTSSAAPPNQFADFAQPVPKTVQLPVIDGHLSEFAWQTAALLSPFQNPEGTDIANTPTETFLMWDAENLYIGVKAYLPDAQLPYISQTQHDSPIWEDECIEILLDPNPKTDVYYHLVINPIRALFDQRVNAPGEPNFRFAPRDVQRTLNQKTMQTAFSTERAWHSKAKVSSHISTTFWSLEVALPRDMLEPTRQQATPASQNRWLFNIHRKTYSNIGGAENLVPETQREYSSWLPIYDTEHPWWPHAPQAYTGELSERVAPAMGLLDFVTAPPPTAGAFAAETPFRVAAIEIKGNATIPTAVIQQQFPIQPGALITNSQLSWLIHELRHHDWFQDIRLETKQVDTDSKTSEALGSVSVHIRVTEAPVRFARRIQIDGNRTFPTHFIKVWFQLEPGYLAVAAVNLKRQLMANFYSNRGYEFATVTSQFANDVLTFTINEGTLHEIRFTGNTRISRTELLSALDLNTAAADGRQSSQTADIYHHALGQSKINRMRKELSKNSEHFKSVQNWRVQREGGKNIMIVEIEEQPFVKPGVFPILQFNRVHGLILGAGGTLATRLTGKEQVFGSISRGFSSKLWNYQAGIGKGFFKRQPLKIGGSFYKLTDVSSNIYLRHGDTSLGAAYYGFALQDYYQRQGSQGWITYAPSESNYLKLEFTAEKHDNLSKSTDWSYFARNRLKRGNSRIKRGELRSLSLVYAFDTRDHRSTMRQHFRTLFYANERARRGWRGQLAVDIAGQRLGGDYAFNFYRFEVARYTPLFGPHHLNVRIAGDFSDAPLPRQRLLHLGGAATLRGYDFDVFAGDNRLLLNLEYLLIKETIQRGLDAVLGWTFSWFLDAGTVWWHGAVPFSDFETFRQRLKTTMGIGGSVFIDPLGSFGPWSLAVELASPLDSTVSLQHPKLILRLERIF